LFTAKSGDTRYSEVTFYARQIFFFFVSSFCVGQCKLFREKHHKIQHCVPFGYCLLAFIFILKILKKFGQEAILCTEEEMLVAFLAFECYLRFS